MFDIVSVVGLLMKAAETIWDFARVDVIPLQSLKKLSCYLLHNYLNLLQYSTSKPQCIIKPQIKVLLGKNNLYKK